ncbi:MAG: isoprenyl transferase [Candidatus Omnitrophica bacterium]|nr:isoprenyl transferase [Candidatus Omnitrophota bacterium]
MKNTNVPRHIAIIMDGNGRWAQARGLSRVQGHQEGVKRVEEVIRAAKKYSVKYLTLYAFSRENWQRPKEEVSFLMGLLSLYLDQKLREMKENNVIFNAIGNLSDLPEMIQEKIAQGMENTRANTGVHVTFAFSYSSRYEITEACRRIAEGVRAGKIKLEEISEETIAGHLYTANLPDPDLLIRTSGEFRISNFLLWQISYAELYISEKFWPEFTESEFLKALEDYQKRERRFGRTSPVL